MCEHKATNDLKRTGGRTRTKQGFGRVHRFTRRRRIQGHEDKMQTHCEANERCSIASSIKTEMTVAYTD